ncbi:MAG: hypothetical protein M3P83_10610 [Actinomycetota bacterium]|nr:hypothetical protein [Actinomycetota bacterium]
MKKVAAALALSIGLLSAAAMPAHATHDCVSKAEFKKANEGMGKKRVHRLFDTAGKQVSIYKGGGETYESREYKPCTGKYSYVMVDYHNGKVEAKYAYWG